MASAQKVSDIGGKFNVAIEFLGEIRSDLEVLKSRIGNMERSLARIEFNMERLTGKPVIDVAKSRQNLIKSVERIWRFDRANVALRGYPLTESTQNPLEGEMQSSESRDVLDPHLDTVPNSEQHDVVGDFLNSGDKVFVVLGVSGTGKTCLSTQLEHRIYQRSGKPRGDADGASVQYLVVRVDLSMLQDVKHDLVGVALASHRYTQAQINEVRQILRGGKARNAKHEVALSIVLICDRYDALSADQQVNLVTTNNFSQFQNFSCVFLSAKMSSSVVGRVISLKDFQCSALPERNSPVLGVELCTFAQKASQAGTKPYTERFYDAVVTLQLREDVLNIIKKEITPIEGEARRIGEAVWVYLQSVAEELLTAEALENADITRHVDVAFNALQDSVTEPLEVSLKSVLRSYLADNWTKAQLKDLIRQLSGRMGLEEVLSTPRNLSLALTMLPDVVRSKTPGDRADPSFTTQIKAYVMGA